MRLHPPYWLTDNGCAVRSFRLPCDVIAAECLLNFKMQPTSRFDRDISHNFGYKHLCAKQLSRESNYIPRIMWDVNHDDVIK